MPPQPPINYNTPGPQIQDSDIVWKAIKSMKKRKAVGLEGIPQSIYNGRRIPEIWKEAWVTPIYKKEWQHYILNAIYGVDGV